MDHARNLTIILLGLLVWKCVDLSKKQILPALAPDPWWGPGMAGKDNPALKPFKINVTKEDIDDLRARLLLPPRLTRPLEGANFTYGFNAITLEKIVEHWKTDYDWKKREAKFNALPQFVTQIEGLKIHFRRAEPKLSPDSPPVKILPLLLLHGWPGSPFEFDDYLPFLTNPQQDSDVIFDVICPSLPGFGFSQASSKQGLGVKQIGQIFLKLMQRLKFNEFYIQGGDWGSIISSIMATLYPENVIGIYSNQPFVVNTATVIKHVLGTILPSGFMMKKEDEPNFYPLSNYISLLMQESGYAHIQGTKSDTIGSALNNSPIGLAAYIIEKFSTWTNKNNPFKPDGGLLSQDFPITIDKLLDNVSLYWFSSSITSSLRLYVESLQPADLIQMDELRTEVPSGFSFFDQNLLSQPENFVAHKFTKIILFRRHQGGHFPAMEVPNVLAKDFHDFVEIVERIRGMKSRNEL